MHKKIIILILSFKANMIGSYSISPLCVLKDILTIQNKNRQQAIQSNWGLVYKSITFGELIYKARIKDDISPLEIEIVLIKFKSLTLYPLPWIANYPLSLNSISSASLLTEARDKKTKIEKANSQNDMSKFVATPPPNILIV